MQRAWTSRSGDRALTRKEDTEDVSPSKQRPQRQTYRQTPYLKASTKPHTRFPQKGSSARDEVPPALASVMTFMKQTDSQTRRRRRTIRASDLKTANRLSKPFTHPIAAEMQAAIVADALTQKIRQRERCGVNQARYRKRQQKVEDDILAEIAKLHSEIKRLELRRLGSSRLPMVPTIWGHVPKYFRHFYHFVSSPATLHAAAANFLREMLAPDVAGDSSFGVEAQINNWEIFAHYFGEADVVLKSLNMPISDTLVASVRTTVIITSNTLRYAFPHLNSDKSAPGHGHTRVPFCQ